MDFVRSISSEESDNDYSEPSEYIEDKSTEKYVANIARVSSPKSTKSSDTNTITSYTTKPKTKTPKYVIDSIPLSNQQLEINSTDIDNVLDGYGNDTAFAYAPIMLTGKQVENTCDKREELRSLKTSLMSLIQSTRTIISAIKKLSSKTENAIIDISNIGSIEAYHAGVSYAVNRIDTSSMSNIDVKRSINYFNAIIEKYKFGQDQLNTELLKIIDIVM